MIPPALYLAFVLTSAVFLPIPGPNVALIVSASLGGGRRAGLATVAGTSSAMAVQLGLTVAGMSALLTVSAAWFSALRWIGVVYLLYLGLRAWRTAPTDQSRTQAEGSPMLRHFLRGFPVALTNPKTLLFFGAFLPQFVSPGLPLRPQLVLLAATFLCMAIAFDCTWALLAARARFVLARYGSWRNRLQGGLLIGAGLGLALARKS